MSPKEPRLLLLSLSGVRVQDPVLLELGLTLPGFVERGEVIASLPALGLLTLAAHTPDDWDVVYREVDAVAPDQADQIAGEAYDLVAISALTARITDAYKLADELRERGVTVVLGGLHVTALPEEASAHADAVVVGEGEAVWPSLLSDWRAGSLRGRYESDGSFDLGSGPTPRYDLLEAKRYNRITLQTTRGCPYDCVFCGGSRLLSPRKVKPVAHVRREVEAILEIWPRAFIELADDNTFVSKPAARELAAALADYPVKWFTETDLTVADDERLLELLARSGCAQLLIGVESVNYDSLEDVDSRRFKQARLDDAKDAIAKIQSYGISVNGCFVFGFDHDDKTVFERTVEFVEASGLTEVQISLLTPFPGTALFRRLQSEGRLRDDYFWDRCTLFDLTYQPARLSADELISGFRDLMQKLYNPDASESRKQNRGKVMRRRRAWRS